MKTTELKHQARLQNWAVAIQEYRSSELSVKQWCRQRGLTPRTYYRWKREVLALAEAEGNAQKEIVSFVKLPPPKQ